MAFFDWHPGTFTIANRMSGKYLDVTNASTTDGTLIQQWQSDAPAFRGPYDQQLWQLLPSVGGMTINRLTGKALDVTNASAANGALLQEWTRSGDPQQRWAIVPLGNGYYKILNTFTHKASDVTGASSSNGAPIQQWDDNGSLQQQWDIIPSDSHYQIVNRLSGKLLDVTNASTSKGTLIQQWSFNDGSQQQWYFAP